MTVHVPAALGGRIAVALTALSILGATLATAQTAEANAPGIGAVGSRANRIVGLWETQGLVGPCDDTPPFLPIVNTLLFNSGGTVVEIARFPPGGASVMGIPGINQRGPAIGTWTYDPAINQYSLHLRFDWFVDNAYHGYMTVDRLMTLSRDRQQLQGPVVAVRYDTAGSTLVELCGQVTSERLH